MVVSLRCFLVVSLAVAASAAEPIDPIQHFESQVRPLLIEHCFKCHAAEKQRGKLRLDSRQALLDGGETGPAIVPGKPAESLLIDAINYGSLEMPPTGRLNERQIAAITKWVELGAPWPESGENAPATVRKKGGGISDADRAYWAFQPVRDSQPPQSADDRWSRGDIDRFLLDRLRKEGIEPAPEADRVTLVRRLYFDLIGLPPSPQEIDQFLADESPTAYERLVDRLLESPRYGERWARYWLDLVRYAESDGFKQDAYRPHTWRYRDYVIHSFNDDKPYDRFVQEQLAGDELAPNDPDALVATGFMRLWIYEYNQRDVRTQWQNILNDVTDVTADVFLGLGMSCSRCHDHKFDPILQRDYFRLQAFFQPLVPRDESLPAASQSEDAEAKRKAWEAKRADVLRQLEEIEHPFKVRAAQSAINKFPRDIRPMMQKSVDERQPLERQLAELAYRQVQEEFANLKMESKLKGDEKARWEGLRKQLADLDADRPPQQPLAMCVCDVGREAPPTIIPGDRQAASVPPGFLTVLDPGDAAIEPTDKSTGRRTALARWLTRPDNPLTPRVIVNRVWQQFFGRGLVATASDFGRLGEPPSHPELLDHLTADFVSHEWRLKHLQRRIVTSAAYRQSSRTTEAARLKDPQNRWYGRRNVRRLEAEQIRDTLLAVTGELDLTAGGPGVDAGQPRRSVYLKVLRNSREPLLDVFDLSDGFTSTSQRNVTTTPTQSLLMMNGPWTLARASAWAKRLQSLDGSRRIEELFRRAYGRLPTESERTTAETFLKRGSNALVDLCHVVLNANELIYVD